MDRKTLNDLEMKIVEILTGEVKDIIESTRKNMVVVSNYFINVLIERLSEPSNCFMCAYAYFDLCIRCGSYGNLYRSQG